MTSSSDFERCVEAHDLSLIAERVRQCIVPSPPLARQRPSVPARRAALDVALRSHAFSR